MADSEGAAPLAAAEETGSQALPRVVLIVREADTVTLGAGVQSVDDPSAEAAVETLPEPPAEEMETARFKPRLIEVEDQPTERIRLKKRDRTAEDDRLAAAVIQLNLDADPGPLEDFLGKSLLYRAARAAHIAGAPRLILVTRNLSASDKTKVEGICRGGFKGGPVEFVDTDPDEKTFGRGRVLLLDPTSLQDGEAIRRLARVKGDKTALLLGQYGDGLRVRTEEGNVAEVGSEISPYDGTMVGACSVPAEDFWRITQVGMRSALDQLGRERLLIGTVATETFARQFRDGRRIEYAQRDCYESLAESGNDGLFDWLIGRPIARLLTLQLLHQQVISPSFVSWVAAILGLIGAAILATGSAAPALAAGGLLILSAVLDRCDGELARLRLEDDSRDLDFYLDHVTHILVMLGLAWGVQRVGPGDWNATLASLNKLGGLGGKLQGFGVSGLMVGFAAVLGILLLLGVLLWRGQPHPRSSGLRKIGDALATSFGSRDYFYLLVFVAILNLLTPEIGVMGLFLILSTALVHFFWISLLLLNVVSPRRPS